MVIGIVHSNPAYLDELYPIKVSFTNNERVPIHAIGTFEFKIAGTEGTGKKKGGGEESIDNLISPFLTTFLFPLY